MTTSTSARQCRRCSGTGQASGGQCFRCDGIGIDPGPRVDSRTPDEIAAARREIALRETLRQAVTGRPRNEQFDIRDGADALKVREPVRYAKMLDSLHAGRYDAVADALLTYYRAF